MTLTLDDLVLLLARGESTKSFTGIYEEQDGDAAPTRWRLYRRGRLARIEQPPGSFTLIAAERTYWRRWPSDPGVVALPREPDHDDFDLSKFTIPRPDRYWRNWLTQDAALVTSTLEATTYEERHAWRFRAPAVKGGTPILTVDAELGLVLHATRPDAAMRRSWHEVQTGIRLGDGLFRYDGPWQLASNYGYPANWVPE